MNKRNFLTAVSVASCSFVVLLASAQALAAGSDDLLKALGSNPAAVTAPAQGSSAGMMMGEIKLNNPVSRQFFADWSAQTGSNIEVNQWAQFFLADKFESFAHLWGALEDKTPATMTQSARAAYLYSLYKLGLQQTFFDEWMASLSKPAFSSSKGAAALEEAIAADFDRWFLDSEIHVSAEQEALIRNVGPARSPIFLSLNAAILGRKGLAAESILSRLPLNSAFRPWLAQTVAVAQAKKNDLAAAARTMKLYYEPWLMANKDPRKLATHYMGIARLLYQAGSLDGAIAYYEKIPNGIPEYLTAREELTWAWLRNGNMDKLRGNLESLTSRALEDAFQPEAYLVRAVSNLKLCYYQEVEKDFKEFVRVNGGWAKKIDVALKASEPESPRTQDIYSVEAVKMLANREAEQKRLEELAERSISAVIPAVGIQKHWKTALVNGTRSIENARKRRTDEFRRQWKNDQITLNEAIRKMQFVKVELLSQVSEMTAQAQQTGDAIKVTASSAQAQKMNQDGNMVFPFDGVMWPDEMFRLRSVAKGRCVGQQ